MTFSWTLSWTSPKNRICIQIRILQVLYKQFPACAEKTANFVSAKTKMQGELSVLFVIRGQWEVGPGLAENFFFESRQQPAVAVARPGPTAVYSSVLHREMVAGVSKHRNAGSWEPGVPVAISHC